ALFARAPVGRGRVVLITTTLNADWNRWPPSSAFPPFLHELVYYAVAPRLRERALLTGEVFELFLPRSDSVKGKFELPTDPYAPRGQRDDRPREAASRNLGDGNVLRYAETHVSGLYKMTIGSHKEREYLFTVNVPSASEDYKDSESNLARASRDELERTYPDWDLQGVTDLAEAKHADLKALGTASETLYLPQGAAIAPAPHPPVPPLDAPAAPGA